MRYTSNHFCATSPSHHVVQPAGACICFAYCQLNQVKYGSDDTRPRCCHHGCCRCSLKCTSVVCKAQNFLPSVTFQLLLSSSPNIALQPIWPSKSITSYINPPFASLAAILTRFQLLIPISNTSQAMYVAHALNNATLTDRPIQTQLQT